MLIEDDKKSVIFLFNENATGSNVWRLIMAPEGVLRIVEDEFIIPIDAPEGVPGIHHWTFESLAPGKTILSFEYMIGDTGVPTDKVLIIIEVDKNNEIHIISTLYERLD